MSWNPAPIYGSAQWNGNSQLATKNQLISSIAGLYLDIQDIEVSTITVADLTVSTLTAKAWISAPELYVSSIIGATLDISGISINGNGVFNAPIVSLSSMSFKGFDSLLDLDVSFDLGLGDAIGGIAAGLGALVGGAAIAVGTGAGLAIQGAEQGIATMVAGRPQNFISQTNYETINFTTQLQISTLGNAQPIYSTIFRTVSSISADQVPGREIFTSSFFYPGQICIRAVSDPFNLITADSNLNTSTIQSFGQWTPLEGLEPENIIANSVSTNALSTGSLYADLGDITTLTGYSGQLSNLGITQSQSMNFNAPLLFDLGSSGDASITGFINQWNFQTNQPIVFSQLGSPGTLTPGAVLTLGTGSESILEISSIQSIGGIKTVNLYASTITAEQLNVVSTLFLTSTNIEVVTSTQTLVADDVFITNASIQNFVQPFSFNTGVGNSNGAYDINKNVTYSSTFYTSVSSLTNNILSYTLNLGVQDEPSFNMGGQGQGSPRASYQPAPQNVEQWASSMIICNPNNGLAASLFLGNTGLWTSSIVKTGTFDLTIDQTKSAFYFVSAENENYNNPQNTSSFLNMAPDPGFFKTYRFTLDSNGWWGYVTPAPPPYITVSSNVFTIAQDINDVYLTTTDRMNFKAGDFNFDGNLAFQTLNVNTLNTDIVNASNATIDTANISTLITPYANISTILQQNNTWGSGSKPNLIEVAYVANIGNVSSLTSTNSQIMTTAQAGIINNYTSQISTFVTRPTLNLSFGTGNTLYLGALGATGINTPNNRPDLNWAFGTIVFDAGAGFSIIMSNYGNINVNGAILNLSNAGTVAATLTLQGIAGTTSIPPGVGATILWNQTVFQPPTVYTAWAPYVITDDFQINQSFGSVQFDTQAAFFTGSIVASSNVVVDGSLRTVGKIATYTPSGGYAGIETTTYTDAPIWTFDQAARWESGAQNLIPRPGGGYYVTTDWIPFVTVQQWNTPDWTTSLNGWTAYAVPQSIGGGVNAWALYRFIQLLHAGPPSPGNFNCDIIMFPKNFTT